MKSVGKGKSFTVFFRNKFKMALKGGFRALRAWLKLHIQLKYERLVKKRLATNHKGCCNCFFIKSCRFLKAYKVY
jgi:hypothetical protein